MFGLIRLEEQKMLTCSVKSQHKCFMPMMVWEKKNIMDILMVNLIFYLVDIYKNLKLYQHL